jgi:hypothetical protein
MCSKDVNDGYISTAVRNCEVLFAGAFTKAIVSVVSWYR